MLYVFLAITFIFILAVLARRVTKAKVCAICVSIAATWLGLLALYKINKFHDAILLSLLMGQSITGVFYWIRHQVPAALQIFALPFLLTLTAAFYFLITNNFVLPALGLLALIWIAAWFIFTYRNDPGKKPIADAAMDCCGEDGEDK